MTKLTGEEVVGAHHKEPFGPRPVAAGSESPGPHGAARAGKDARLSVPLDSPVEPVTDGRADPVTPLEGQAATPVADLVPIRYGVKRDFYLRQLRDGKGSVVAEMVSERYAEQNERDHAALVGAVATGRRVARSGL